MLAILTNLVQLSVNIGAIDETDLSPTKETKIRVKDALAAEEVLASEESKGTFEDQRQADRVEFVSGVTGTLEPGSSLESEEMLALTAKTKEAGSFEVKGLPAGKVTMRDALNGKECGRYTAEKKDKFIDEFIRKF